MHELLTYRLAIDDWEFDQKSSSLNHLLDWIPNSKGYLATKKKKSGNLSPLFTTDKNKHFKMLCDFGLHEDLKREIVWRWDYFQVLSNPCLLKDKYIIPKQLLEIWTSKEHQKKILKFQQHAVEKIIMWTVVDSIINGSLRSSSTFLRRAKCVCSILNNMFLPHKSTLKVSSASRLPCCLLPCILP